MSALKDKQGVDMALNKQSKRKSHTQTQTQIQK